MLRWLTYILSLYILVLAVLPCTDHLIVPIQIDLTHLAVDSHDHDQESRDTCTPLCGCSCCGVHISEVSFFWYETPEQPIVYKIANQSFATKFPISDYNGSIWQPPKAIV